MNEGDLAKAALATTFLRLPPILAGGETGRIEKARPEDPKDPGWPKGAPDAQSYKFGTGRMPLCDYLRGASIERQRAWGIWALEQVGAIH